MIRNIETILLVLFLFTFSSTAIGLSGGITAYSGQGGQTCSNCHTGGTVPTVTLTTANTSVLPGSTVTLTLNLSGGQQNVGGFGVSADGGTLVNTLGTIAQINAGELIHSQAITVGATPAVWNFDWQAPTAQGLYTIYAASVSANGDGGTGGDAAAAAQITLVVSATGNVPPTASFQAPSIVTQGLVVDFDGTGSNDPDGTIADYSWDFGDGNTGTGVTTSHTFANIGTYAVVLAVTDDGGLSQTATRSIRVVAPGTPIPPTANIGGPYSGEAGQDITFDASNSTDPDGTVARYLWDFGDGSAIAQGANPVHAFANAGSYTVTLAVTDNDGLTNAIATTVDISAQASGQQLFTQFCSACHHTGSGGDVSNATVSGIQSAITGVGEMNGINLSGAEIQRIVDFMSGNGGGGGGGSPGKTLYDNNCMSCHGAGGTGGLARNIVGTSTNAITSAITNIASMGNITLSAAEIQSIVEYLATGGGGGGGGNPTTGIDLYDLFCAACHGAAGGGGTAIAIIGVNNTQITGAIANIAAMNSINLTGAEIQLIANYLGTVAKPTDGPGLFQAFCDSCHGPNGNEGNVDGAKAKDIEDAISKEAVMNFLQPILTAEEIQLIADYLNAGGN